MYMQNSNERPIGYWLKHLDRLIDAAMDRAFADEGVTRRHWQILNILRQSPQDAPGLTDALRPFWTDSAVTLDEVTGDLARRGWLTGAYALTPAGEAAHAAVQRKVHGIRATFLTGLADDEYHRTVRTLRHMAENLRPYVAPER
jgi:DNA-binding MarR family transcriptional regulator